MFNNNNSAINNNQILWNSNIPKGFEKYFPSSDKNKRDDSPKENKKQDNPFDFRKSGSDGGGGGSGKLVFRSILKI